MVLEDKDLKSIQEARILVKRAAEAQKIYQGFSQAQVDRITAAAVRAASKASEELARLAVEESGFGRIESKIEKNRFSSESLWEDIKDQKTVGIIARDDWKGVVEIAEPYGVIVGIIPITNPTSTTLFKGIIALKTRNAIVFSPHPRGIRCISESSRVMQEAAEAAGAPPGLMSCLSFGSMEGIEEAMRHPLTSLILATGGGGLVKAAYSTGKPAYGVGPGNAPAFIERSANIHMAVKAIIASQTFDNGTVCAAEQAVVIDEPIKDRVIREFLQQGAHLCSDEEKTLLERIVMKGGGINPDVVGRYPHELGKMAGFSVPEDTTVLLAWENGVGPDHPLSIEKLSPILAVYTAKGWEKCCELCIDLLNYGGMGHTMAIHSRDEEIIMKFALEKPVHRILVNAPTSQGAVGHATGLVPSMTLGCGAYGGNITSDNISARNLILIKRMARVKPGFVEGCDVRTRSTYRPGHLDLDNSPGSVSSSGLKDSGYAFRNEALNASSSAPPVFTMKPSSGASSGEGATSREAGNAPSVAEVPPERCPLGGGCEQCASEEDNE